MPLIDEQLSYVDSVNPDLGKFKSKGGKLLLTHGWADTSITPETTVLYYDSVLNKMGKNQSDWMRLFMVPGMGHCGGGPGVNTFDSIGTLEKWVEKGVAPDQMMGTGAQGLTRPLCPYPQAAQYKGNRRFEGRSELGVQSELVTTAEGKGTQEAQNSTSSEISCAFCASCVPSLKSR